MKMRSLCVVLLLGLVFLPLAGAGQIRTYVAEFKVVGAERPDEMKGLLPDLLGSRLSKGGVAVVGTRADADVVVTGRYTQAGKLFSLDAVASDAAGKTVGRDYVEGDDQGQLLPALGKLAAGLATQITASAADRALPQTVPAASAGRAGNGFGAPSAGVAAGVASTGTRWLSQRLTGSFIAIAPGRRFENGERELFVAGGHALKLFRTGKELRQIAEVSFPVDEQLLGVDSADLDGDGRPEAYVTIFNGDALVSQVWVVRDDTLVRKADRLPYFFRSIAMDNGNVKLYAQEIALKADFFGDVREVAWNGTAYTLQNPVKLPRGAMLYNFSRFRDEAGNELFVLLNDDGNLVVHAADGEELWRSKEKYGGTELAFKRTDLTDVKYGSDPYRWIFLQQRIFVTPEGEIVVPQNIGSWSMGHSRTFNASRMLCFRWNGSSLEKGWQTEENEQYLADYFYDPAARELVSLEVVKHEGMFGKGASIVSIRKIR
ncbi:FG-GAP repeat domain-containing protein [Geobacter argillaceus]|uniref:VCBS repeat protein n=1 Tax=Geobacter argillaceus TaxID=345631 RepID=A0A562WQZ5_9BACT|nr:VCBS repeat-containing protein [Geobacter argillaceus]TWJ32622.1 hypothetical protein JN12_00596 [Geobacter argillaceus]